MSQHKLDCFCGLTDVGMGPRRRSSRRGPFEHLAENLPASAWYLSRQPSDYQSVKQLYKCYSCRQRSSTEKYTCRLGR
eukprot:976819-Pleurochrysis_carterae.AAC.3